MKIVCIVHGRVMRMEKSGVLAQENIDAKGVPYKIYSYDMYVCPEVGCPNVILAGHGNPVHYGTEKFEEWQPQVEEEFW
jgi:hypothetical protein